MRRNIPPRQRAALSRALFSRRGFIPERLPRSTKPDLPIPTLTEREEHALRLRRIGVLTIEQEQRDYPGLHAKLILIHSLNGSRGKNAARRYEIFDQLPRGLRDMLNEDRDLLHHFNLLIAKARDIKYIVSQLRDLNRRARSNTSLADL